MKYADMQETGWGFKSVLVTVIRSVDETGDHFCPDILSDIFQRYFALQKLPPLTYINMKKVVKKNGKI